MGEEYIKQQYNDNDRRLVHGEGCEARREPCGSPGKDCCKDPCKGGDDWDIGSWLPIIILIFFLCGGSGLFGGNDRDDCDGGFGGSWLIVIVVVFLLWSNQGGGNGCGGKGLLGGLF